MLIDKINTTAEESDIIIKIVDRVERLKLLSAYQRTRLDFIMDLEVVHSIHGLDLERLLKSDNFSFVHDVCGIANNLDRETGDLLNCFLPRFTAKADN
jgi:hypothetical protein